MEGIPGVHVYGGKIRGEKEVKNESGNGGIPIVCFSIIFDRVFVRGKHGGGIMQLENIKERLKTAKRISYEGTCNDCEKNVLVSIHKEGKTIVIEGGAVYAPDGALYFKCNACFDVDSKIGGHHPEMYTGVSSTKKKGRRG